MTFSFHVPAIEDVDTPPWARLPSLETLCVTLGNVTFREFGQVPAHSGVEFTICLGRGE